LEPEAIAEFLASFRCRATRAIEAHGGIVDKFVGDDVMGVFGVPTATTRDAANALAAGRALQAEIAAWNEKRQSAGRRPVSVGIGIHYGQVFAGVIDGGQRLEFTVIGDAVNTAQRIEELTKTTGWSLLVSAELLEATKIPLSSRDCHPLLVQTVRGRKEPMRLFAPRAKPHWLESLKGDSGTIESVIRCPDRKMLGDGDGLAAGTELFGGSAGAGAGGG
jgi:adenylate cyclase